MATSKKSRVNEPVSKDNPRLLERVSDGAKTRVTDQTEYLNLTTGHGYRDVTDGGAKSGSNVGTGSGTTGTVGTGGAASKAGDA